MEKGTSLLVIMDVSHGEVVAVCSTKEIAESILREELSRFEYLTNEDIEEMMDEGSYDEYFTVDVGVFFG